MSIPAVFLHPDPTQAVLLRGTIRGGLPSAFAAARDYGASAFCAIRTTDVPALDALGDDLIRVARPRQKEQIAQGMRLKCALLVTKAFTCPARAVQSLSAYRANCDELGGWAVVFVGLADPMFAALRRDAADPPLSARRLLGLDATIRWDAGAKEDAPDEPAWAWDIDDDSIAPSLREAFIGDSPAAKRVRFFVMVARSSELPVIILGENGTGKEIVARQIHALSDRCGRPLVPVNVSGIPESLFESEMFGHKKGAFTGAYADHDGYFLQAANGTLFLDEIGDLSLTAQAKILRAIESRHVQILGGPLVPATPRFFVATNKDLFGMAESGKFRRDLLERLHGLVIRTPPLRAFPDDIALIARTYWRKYEKQGALPLSLSLIEALQQQPWKGNVRELCMRLDVLYEIFGKMEVGPDQLNALLLSEESEILGLGLGEKKSIRAVWLARLEHVCRAMEVIRLAQLPMRGPIEEGAVDPVTLARVAIQLRTRSADLESLCTKPPRFHYDKAFGATRVFKNVLRGIRDQLLSQPEETLRAWKTHGEPASEQATRLLFVAMHQLERLLRMRRSRKKSRGNQPPDSVNPQLDLE